MNLTIDHLIQTTCNELSSRRIERFTLSDLSKLAGTSRSSIYYHFGSIEYLYKAILEQIILENITEGCTSSDELFVRFVTYVSENRNLCLNLYFQTNMMVKNEHRIKALNKLLMKYDNNDHSDKTYMIASFLYTLKNWFDNNLNQDKQYIIDELLAYNRFMKQAQN